MRVSKHERTTNIFFFVHPLLYSLFPTYCRLRVFANRVAFTDGNGGVFDTTTTRLLVADGAAFTALKLDPAVIKYPNGRIACYIGAAPFMGQTDPPKLIAAWGTSSTSVDNYAEPTEFSLNQNYPNPFNPSTIITYNLPANENVRLIVYNLLGEEIKTLVNGLQSAGSYSTMWDGTNERGEPVGSGIYFYRLGSGNQFEVRKMALTR